MEELTELGKLILTTDKDKAKLDQIVKKILAYRPLLARIFKEVVVECKDMRLDDIESCIEGDVKISEVYVDSGLSNKPELINGLNTEAYVDDEGLIKYDIRTYLKIPGAAGKEEVKLYINVESQNEDKPGYDIPLRALFYCSRMISAQQGVEFTTKTSDSVKYDNIKKVYSIWICTEAAEVRANSIENYDIRRGFLAGYNNDNPRYDILNAVIIYISKDSNTDNTDNGLIKLLTDLFDKKMSGAEKIDKLSKEHGLILKNTIKEEVSSMCNYADAIERNGIEQGIAQGMAQGMAQGIAQGVTQGIEQGLRALVRSLKKYIKDFDALYSEVISNEEFRNVTRDEVKNCLIDDQS